MVNTPIPRYIFLSSLAITIVIFVAGLMLGYNLDSFRTDDVMTELQNSEIETESYVVEQLFWDSVEGEGCGNVDVRISSLSVELGELGQDLVSYEQKSLFSDAEYEYLARKYFLEEIRTYILFNSLKETCDLDKNMILFFYDPEDSESETQGYVLDKVRNTSNNTVLIFSFNSDFEGENAIESMELYYNITETPTMIINENIKQVGYTSFSEVLELLG